MHLRRTFGSAIAAALVAAAALPATATSSPFTEEAIARGLDFTMIPYPQTQGWVGQGVAFVDLDGDSDPDVVILGRSNQVGIFENIGAGIFVDRSATSGIPTIGEQEGIAAADYDGDGDLDLYITQVAGSTNHLLRNNGSFTFTDVSFTAGVSNGPRESTGPSWGDYNNDGWLDLYVSNYAYFNELYRNNGTLPFTTVGASLGVSAGAASLSFQTVWTDYDRDGDVDLYLSNDRAPHPSFPGNFLWRNDNGTLVDVSAGSGADVEIYSMGIGAGDIDNNGYPDLYMTNIHTFEGDGEEVAYDGINPLLLNQGNGTYVDKAEDWGVDNRTTSWGAVFFDWDNDTHMDLYVNNQFEPNHFFHCSGTIPCTQMASTLAIQAEFDPNYDLQADPQVLPYTTSYISAVADVDGDGDLDLLVNNPGHRAELFINQEGHKNDWVRYDIVGEHPNLFAVGAGVETTSGGTTQFHEIYAGGNGYLGQNELIVHVGLGTAESVQQTVVDWPSGGPSRTLTGLPANNTWKIYPPSRLCDLDGDGVDYDDFVSFAGCFVAGFSSGCEMMDEDGDSNVHVDDLAQCHASTGDCNANGTEDTAEILLDLTLDGDQDYLIDCCETGTPDDPNEVGNTLLLDKNGSDQPMLSWTAPAVDATHAAATSYDVFRADAADLIFGLLTNVVVPTRTDPSVTPHPLTLYLVGARNDCGSSGEEPF